MAEYPDQPPDDGFNPHGISVRPEINLMVTSDFICPATTLHAVPGGLELRGSVRVWNFKKRKIVRTITLPNPAGTIDVKLIPGYKKERAYTAGMVDDQLYLLDDAGKVHAEGDHRINVAKVTSNELVLDPRFQLDFNTAIATGPARPHGVAFK